MVAHFTMRTHGVNQAIRFVKAFGYIERVVKSGFFFRKRTILLNMCPTSFELPSYISTVANILYLFGIRIWIRGKKVRIRIRKDMVDMSIV